MPFETLPTFPQGGVARADSGNLGIPPESFQQALHDAGSTLITSTKRPEDSPAVQAALGAEVDRLIQQGVQPPAAPTGPAPSETPGAPNPPAGTPPAPATSGDLSERIRKVMEKYSSPEEIAKAYVHTDAARTRAQQERAYLERQQAQSIAALGEEIGNIRAMLESRNAGGQSGMQGPGAGYGGASPTQAQDYGNEDPEAFFKNPRPIIRDVVNDVVTSHMSAYAEAQRRIAEAQRFDELRKNMQQDIEQLRPFMDEVYVEDREIYDSLPPDRALPLLVKRAKDRKEAYKARAYHQEITALLGGNGTPASNAAPGQSGALPSPGSAMRRPEPAQGGDWSNTPTFNRLWKSRSDSVDEMKVVTDILRERGVGEDIPIY